MKRLSALTGRWIPIFMILTVLVLPFHIHADAIVGETVVTLGKNLSPQERVQILKDMQVPQNVKTIDVTNAEEHQYLGKYMSKATIGSKAISSAKITITDAGTGISVKTKNISTISEAIYANAAITAGIKDAEIYVLAPYKVSGTAGLTGIFKAFEAATGQKIDENKKQVANEEMVRTSEIGKAIQDPNKAAQFMNKLKEEISTQKPATATDYEKIIVNVSDSFNINLDQQTKDELVKFLQNFSSLNIDWATIKDQLSNLGGELSKILNSEQAQGIIDTTFSWLGVIFSAIGDFFSSFSSK